MTQKEKENQDTLFALFKNGEIETVSTLLKEEKRASRSYDYEFDFKYLMEEYYRFYGKDSSLWGEMWSEWSKNCNPTDGDPIKLWYTYKKMDENEKYRPFDCDSSNGTNDLMDKIYDLLWRNQEVLECYDIRKKFGGDTMNSFASTFNALAKTIIKEERQKESKRSSFKDSFKKYIEDPSHFAVLKDYAKYTGCLGNFTLVPNGYNRYRGKSKRLADYWDLSLHNLRYNKDGNDWLEDVEMTFRKYVNIFFLWDYVDKKYKVLPLFSGHEPLLNPENFVYPNNDRHKSSNEFEEFTNNVNIRIRRRGIFMAAMLEIASKREDDYPKILNELAVDKCLGSMENVLTRLKENFDPTEETGRFWNAVRTN